LILAIFLFSGIFFIIDLLIPLGFSGGVPYLFLCLFAVSYPGTNYINLTAILGSILTIAGFFLSPVGGEIWIVFCNRVLALAALWVIAFCCVRFKNSFKNVQNRYQLTLETNNIGIWDYDVTTENFFYSKEWFSMLGYETNQFRPGLDTWKKLLHPNDLKIFVSQFEKFLAGKLATYKAEFRLKKEDGSFKWFLSEGKIIEKFPDATPKRVLGFQLNIDQQKKYERQLELFCQQNLCFWELNIKTKTKILNQAWLNKLGYELSDIEPTLSGYSKIIHPDDLEKLEQKIIKNLINGENKYYCEYRVLSKSGEIKWYLDQGEVVEKDEFGKPLLAMGIAVDITDSKKFESLEKQIFHLDKLTTFGQISAYYAHELNNPIQGILSTLSFIKEEIKDKIKNPLGLVSSLEQITAECLRMGKIIKKMHNDYSPSPNNKAKFNVHELIDDVLFFINYQIYGKPIKLEKDYYKTDLFMYGVSDQIKQAILNIIKNSLESEYSGALKIKISTDYNENSLNILISDNGNGISKEDLKYIFKPFVSNKEKGSGLGLYISRMLIQEHGGSLQITSKLNFGTNVRIVFPVNPPNI